MNTEAGRPVTRWCGPNPYEGAAAIAALARPARGNRAGARATRTEGCAALLALLEGSLARGYWRVAVRRFLMLTVRGFEVPAEIQFRCQQLAGRLAAVELERIWNDAHDGVEWAGDRPLRAPS